MSNSVTPSREQIRATLEQEGKTFSVRNVRAHLNCSQSKAQEIVRGDAKEKVNATAQAIVTELPPVLAKALDEYLQGKLEALKAAYQEQLDELTAQADDAGTLVDTLEKQLAEAQDAVKTADARAHDAETLVNELREMLKAQSAEVKDLTARAHRAEGALDAFQAKAKAKEPKKKPDDKKDDK